MSETSAKTASSLAITEKQPHKPGGCVGIFFQLFDWNRRFAKKKLFPKKLLPPARAKETSRKFAGDEKLPKLRLIASENSGGFPNVLKNGGCDNGRNEKSGMRSPSLVARLMGLESMPAEKQDKVKKASLYETGSDKGSKSIGACGEFYEEGPNLEKASGKHELRPQKLQKTGASDRQLLSRFGAEALQFKSVLSQSRKQRTKLVSPVKSPRNGRNASRLIDVAARILEPGLHARNRAKCALAYSGTTHHIPKDEIKMEVTMAQSSGLSKNSEYYVTTSGSLKGQSCKNCGGLVDVANSCPNQEQQPLPYTSSVSNYVNSSLQGFERGVPMPAISSLEQEKERVSERSQDQPLPATTEERNNLRTRAEAITKRKPLNREDQIQWYWTSQECKPQKDVRSSIAFKHKTHRQNQISPSRDRVPPRSLHTNRVSSAANAINETKDFVAMNHSLSRATRSRMPSKVDNCKYDAERKSSNKRDDSLSPVRKRRSINVNHQAEKAGFVSSTFAKPRNVRCDTVAGIGMGLNGRSMNRTCRSTKARLGESNRTSSNEDGDVISFTFSSPIKQKTESGFAHSNTPEISILDKTDRKMSPEESFPLSGDALGVLLEQKLKELTCQEEDELATGGTQPKRTTAMILQELISALTADRPVSHDDVALGSNKENVSCHRDHLLNQKLTFQAKDKTGGVLRCYLPDGDHLSPGSVLDACFSNDSCLSSSVDDNSAPNLFPDSGNCSYHGVQNSVPDVELSDSATSLSKERNGLQLVTNLLRHISEALYSIGLLETELKGSKLVHAEDVILNTELIFSNAALQNSNGSRDFSVCQFLIFELGILASALWPEFGEFLNVEDTNDGNQLKQFLFDCVIEYLDSRYGLYGNSGFKAWARMPLCMTSDTLTGGVVVEVKRWTRLAGKIPDHIIERDMSHSLGKWTDFEIEAYEAGAEIGRELLQILVDEIVIDLYEGKPGSSSPYDTVL
ncbi:uncharacterized protein LOC130769398 [Actinidia eriantha]|uniref:uncharacterized protein LOC130769398 n=1 Tax=Actinidia eriantha TaxID=165200 RepID=UPI002588D145|nr:uncharacterized protein LOC130769398 [Actinidia eriantha]